jgi:hypothetical protein
LMLQAAVSWAAASASPTGLPRSRAVIGGSLFTEKLTHLAALYETPTAPPRLPAERSCSRWSRGARHEPSWTSLILEERRARSASKPVQRSWGRGPFLNALAVNRVRSDSKEQRLQVRFGIGPSTLCGAAPLRVASSSCQPSPRNHVERRRARVPGQKAEFHVYSPQFSSRFVGDFEGGGYAFFQVGRPFGRRLGASATQTSVVEARNGNRPTSTSRFSTSVLGFASPDASAEAWPSP